MWKLKFILVAILLLPVWPILAKQQPGDAVGNLWLDVRLGPPLVDWYNSVAQPNDIARVDSPSQLDLLDQVTVGRKLVVFKSAAEAERLLPNIADQIDIVGYNLEHGPANPEDEQADPVRSAQRMHDLVDQYGLTLAFGPDHDFALSHGVAIAPFVDIFVLQVQRVQTQPQTVFDFVLPLIPELRAANPDLEISIQVRTEGDVVAIADLVASLEDDLDGVSILTSPETVPIAEDLVEELRRRTDTTNPTPVLAPTSVVGPDDTAAPVDQQEFLICSGILVAGAIGGLVLFLMLSRNRE